MKRKHIQTWLFALMAGLLLSACQKETEIISLSGKTMGTTYHIKYIDSGNLQKNAEQAHEQIEGILRDINVKMSTYDPNSELSRFNQRKEINQPVDISADLAFVIQEAVRLNQITEGALDITVGPIVNL